MAWSMWNAPSDRDYYDSLGNYDPADEPIDEIEPEFSPEFLEGYYARRAGFPMASIPYEKTYGPGWRKHRDWIDGWETADQELAQDPGDATEDDTEPARVAA